MTSQACTLVLKRDIKRLDFEELSPIICLSYVCLSYVWLSYVRRETYCGSVRGELVSEEILIEAWVPQHQLGGLHVV